MKRPKFKQTVEMFEKTLQDRELILYGKGKDAAAICKNYNVKYIVDRNDELCDVTVENIKIYSPDKLYSEDPDKVTILICTAEKYYYEVTDMLQRIDDYIIFYWNVLNNDFLNDISKDLYNSYDQIRSVEKRLWDDYSRKTLREVVTRRMAGIISGYDDLKVDNEIQYIFPPALFSKNGALLDCGGYIGDTIDRFVNKLGNNLNKIYSFEALPENIAALKNKKDEVSKVWDGEIIIIPFALANKSSTISFCEASKRGGSFSPNFRSTTKFKYVDPTSIFEVKAVAIDDIIAADEPVGYIKMDIEGAEYEALIGAEKTIKREKPGLAISIYHNANDYYRLAELILNFVPEYKLAVRHHKARYVDTVLYAWV